MKSYNLLPNNLFKGNLKAHYEVRQLVVTKCDSLVYYEVRQLAITKCDSYFISKCDRSYKLR